MNPARGVGLVSLELKLIVINYICRLLFVVTVELTSLLDWFCYQKEHSLYSLCVCLSISLSLSVRLFVSLCSYLPVCQMR